MAQRKAAAVSMEKTLDAQARQRATALGFSTFSAYVVQLIRKDLKSRGSLTVEESGEEETQNVPEEEQPNEKPKRSTKKKA